MKVYESVLSGASGGFGEYDMGEACLVDGVETIEEWVALAEGNGFSVREASEISGKVHGQNGATIYALTIADGESLHAVSVDANVG